MVLAEDGVVVDLVDGRAAITGRVEVGRVYVDGLAVGDIGESTLGDRLVLGEGGFISITVAVDATTGRAVVPADALRPRLLRRPEGAGRGAAAGRGRAVAGTEAEGITDTHRIAQAVRRVVGRWVGDTYRRRPMIVPTVIAV